MRTSNEGIEIIKRFEGCRLKAYKPVSTEKYFTIGYGHYGPDVKNGMTITQAQAEAYLRADLEKFEKNVMKYDSIYHWQQASFDAMVSFAYNLGSIDKLTANGHRTKEEISEKILAYNKAGGKILQGLVTRRNAEKSLFDRDLKKSEEYPVLKMGSKGEYVRTLQQMLNKYGANLVEDGCYGPKTQQEVIAFQGLKNLKKDGIVGKNTWKALRG